MTELLSHDYAFRHRFVFLLVALILLMLAMPIVHLLEPAKHPNVAEIVITAAFALMLFSGIVAVSQSRLDMIVAVSLGGAAFVLQLANLFIERRGLVLTREAAWIAFLTFAIVIIIRFLFASDRVTLNMICASLCVYLLLAVLWAMGYSLLEMFLPGSFSIATDANAKIHLGSEETIFAIYYSLVTLTTLGYGDIVPVSSPARMLAAVEAVVGQLYIAVLVARLVGMHIAQPPHANGGHRDGR